MLLNPTTLLESRCNVAFIPALQLNSIPRVLLISLHLANCNSRQPATPGSPMHWGRGGKPPPGPPPPLPTLADPAPPDIHFRLLIQQYVVVACLTVSLPPVCSQFRNIFRILNYVILQLCVWDWLLTIAEEFEMIRRIQRLAGYLLHGLYLITR
jgi:hypothetical protein